ncbi:MAG: magnesium/cobalt transporter CorA [Gammaproteobacteria bacterium]|jgi:magnesium transporter
MLYNSVTQELKRGDVRLLDEWRAQQDTVLWADLWGEDPQQEKRVLIQGFGLHPMAVQDAQRERHPPKLEPFDNYVFILLKGLGPDKPDFVFDTIQIAMFVGKRFLITRHADDSPSIDRLWQEVDQDRSLFVRGPDALALRLSRIIVDRYLKKLLGLESRIEVLEQDMINEPRDEMLAELIGYKTQLRKFRRVFLYQVQIFAKLAAHQPPGIRAERVHEINDVYEHQDRANSLATLYYELASDLIDGYISLASHNLNHIIKILTIITAIFVPLSFLAGVYGMNFENMPELHARSGYFILLGVMAGIVLLLLYAFRRMRWL